MWKTKEGYSLFIFLSNYSKGENGMKIEHLELTDSTSEFLKRKKDKEDYYVV